MILVQNLILAQKLAMVKNWIGPENLFWPRTLVQCLILASNVIMLEI